ncbi:DUF3429 domain-containing protein [Primorskyibacter sedentarius]|uniref:DUF3429 domain-containing protein n=1 Tax=Primorskyibacter sedentarius TaxID=745311 RepID=UPI003EB8F4EA
MTIPRPALVLGLLGLIPFLFGAGLHLSPAPEVAPESYPLLVPGDGVKILASYGLVIFCFMSGVLWGFAAAAPGKTSGALPYILSVIPALAAFFGAAPHIFGTSQPSDALRTLLVLFPALIILDWYFVRVSLAPPWWLRLRLLLTAVVTACLAIGVSL